MNERINEEQPLSHNEAHEQEQLHAVEGERGVPAASSQGTGNTTAGRQAKIGLVMMSVLAVIGFWVFRSLFRSNEPKEEKKAETESYAGAAPAKVFEDLPPPPKAPPTPAPPDENQLLAFATPPPSPPSDKKSEGDLLENDKKKPPSRSSGGNPKPRPPVLDKGQSPLMATSGGAQAVSRTQNPEEYAAGIRSGAIPLSAALPVLANQEASPSANAVPSGQSSASFMGDRNYLLAQGSFIECVLQTKLDSTVAGFVSCVISRNIFSDNGKVLLIERGSTVSGEYQSDIQQGQARLYVLWTRIKTPTGVVVALESPGTDPLGGAGVPGQVNNHFFARFGSALLLSLVDDVAGAAVAGLTKDGGQTFNFGGTAGAAQGAAAEIIKSTIQIKPTLTKNQGEVVGIYVARDLDFSGVYRVQ